MSTPIFVTRSNNPNYKTPDNTQNLNAIGVISYYLSLSPANTIDPNSALYKLAIKQYNESLKGSLVRPPIPQFFCGKVDQTTGELTIDLTDYSTRLSAGLVITPLQITSTVVTQLSGDYRNDQCLAYGLPGSFAYSQCQLNSDMSLSDGTYTAFSTSTTTPSAVKNTTGRVTHATTFLRNNTNTSSLRFFSSTTSDSQRNELITFNMANGYTVFYIMAAASTSTNNVLYNSSKKTNWRTWMNLVRQSGSKIVMWVRGDGSPDIDSWSDQKFEDYCRLLNTDLGDLISEYVIGLEVNEYWSISKTNKYMDFLRRLSGKRVGVHTGSLQNIDYAKESDVFYLQTGFGGSTNDVKSQVAYAINYLKTIPVICAEYAKSGETQSAKNLGDAAIDAGAVGVGCGCDYDRIIH